MRLSWPAGKTIVAPAVLLTGLPVLVSLPELLGVFNADPIFRGGMLALRAHGAVTGGSSIPIYDGNDGWTTQALGRLVASDWAHFVVPWWNPYSGIGLPLAGEYQPAAFSPLTLLQLLPNAMVLQHVILQIIAGWGTFLLLRQLRVSRLAAVVGGLLFAFNATMAVANHAPVLPIPYLPWTVLGIELIHQQRPAGWALFSLALALSIAAGFPETAYVDGLFALAWACLRLVQAVPGQRASYVGKLALGGAVALAINAPQLLAFVQFLPHAAVGEGHAGAFGDVSFFAPIALVSMFISPFAYGPMHQYLTRWPEAVFALSEGFVSLSVVTMAVLGLARRGDGLRWVLGGWTVLALAKTFNLQPISAAWNLIPGMSRVVFFLYGDPSWEFAFALLAAFGVDLIGSPRPAAPRPIWRVLPVLSSAMLVAAGLAAAIAAGPPVELPGLRIWFALSMSWAVMVTAACLVLAWRGHALGVAAALVGEAIVIAVVPNLSYPAHARLDQAAISFLKDHLALQRFYTLAPFQPNYGAYFQLASVNYNYLPIARQWMDWVRAHLDSGADMVTFGGLQGHGGDGPSAVDELRRNLPNYEWLGVKYVLVPYWLRLDPGSGSRLVYTDPLLRIWQLPDPAPYFEIRQGTCATPVALSRTEARLRCATPATLLRRELFFPGWSARVNGRPAEIRSYGEILQAVAVPAGDSTVSFAFAPPYSGWAWLVMGVGLGTLIAGWVPALRRDGARR